MKFYLQLLALLFILPAAALVIWLFLDGGTEYKHYEGHFGATCDNYLSWDEMTQTQKEAAGCV